MQNFRDLRAWTKAHRLVLDVYRATTSFPRCELYGLTSQIRRSAVSIPSNIAEGSKRQHPADFAHFLNMSEASAAEVEYLCMVSRDLGYASAEAQKPLSSEIDDISRMLHALRTKVQQGAE